MLEDIMLPREVELQCLIMLEGTKMGRPRVVLVFGSLDTVA